MNSKLLKKAGASAMAAAMALNTSVFGSLFTSTAADDVKYEFENGTLVGATVQEKGSERYFSGSSGDSFVFLMDSGETASVEVNADSAGMYSITLCFSSPYGDKIHNLYVNGVDQGQFSCAETGEGEWVELNLGVVKLNKGKNEIMVKSSWGWTDLDYITVAPAELAKITASDTSPCDSSATSQARSLMSYLSSVYGEHILAGQQEIYKYGPHDFSYEFDYIKDTTGKLPAVRGFDFLNCNPLYGSDDGTTERIIDWVKNNNGIATASWHINVPVDFSNYTLGQAVDWSQSTYSVWKDGSNNTVPATDFDTSKAIVKGTPEYEYYQLCLKGLAAELSELQDAGVPLIFRPLHEAEGGGGETGSWFWWGQDGSSVYKELWKLTYKTLTETYGLHNLIWEWNSYNYDSSANWYPGDEYVDIIGYDKYNCTVYLQENNWQPSLVHNDSAIASTFYGIMERYNSKKMVAMAENDSIPTLDNILTEKAGWLYFCPWYDGGSDNTNFLSNELFNKKSDLIDMYTSDYCITLDELPADLYSKDVPYTPPTTTTTVTTASNITTTTTTTVTNPPVSSDKGFYCDGTVIRDANGNAFEMRGINVAHAWYASQTKTSIEAAASLGTNCIRVVCADGGQWGPTTETEIKNIIQWCKDNKQVCILEAHDATGSDNASDIVKAAEYWAQFADILNENRAYVILNIANEWFGSWDGAGWADGCKQAIKTVRNAGIKNMIMIDSAGWGQYPDSIKNYGKEVAAADTEKNTVFSIHMYEYAGGSASTVKTNIDNALTVGVPVVIGEFGYKHTGGDVDEATIMSYCAEKNLGYIGWSWKGNSGGVEYLDLTNDWEGTDLTEWGDILFNGANGIKASSKICSVYESAPVSDAVYGDANVNGEVEVADAILILQSLANPSKYTLSEQGRINADCCNVGSGVDAEDALAVQQFLADIVTSLPVA